jgi:DNA-binding response OmpR family regulator
MSVDPNPAKILVVDDDIYICNLITRFLAEKNYEMQFANDGETALKIFAKFIPDLVILDINLPDTLGYNLCEQMQNINSVFVLMLTSRNDAEDKKRGFLKGADDYLTKPFNIEELLFRVQAILRRKRTIKPSQQKLLKINNMTIDLETREVKVSDILISLTSLEFDLLYFLASNPGKVWRREELIQNVWNEEPIGDNRVVDVHIGQIRRKIEADPNQPSFILTVRGVGYKFETFNH